MPEPMTIAAGIAAVKNGFDIAKSIREGLKKPTLDRNEIANQLLLLQDIMLDSQRALSDADNALRALQTQLNTAKELEADKLWEPDGSFFLRKSDKAAGNFIPYCPICWTAAKAAIPMAPYSQPGTYKCGLHDPVYATAENEKYQEEQRQIVRNFNSRRGGPNSWMG